MKVQVSRPLSGLSIAAAIAFAAFAASAQTTPMMRGEMKDEDMVKGCDMMGGDMTCMMQMMSMMREKLSHAGDRVAALKADLKITEAQMPAWNKFADALLAAAKSMEEFDGKHAQANDAVWRRREPSREARTPCENVRWTSRKSAGDQGCARTALRLVQRRTEEVRGRAKDRPHGRDVTGAGPRPRAHDH